MASVLILEVPLNTFSPHRIPETFVISGIELGSPALQENSLLAELPGSPPG